MNKMNRRLKIKKTNENLISWLMLAPAMIMVIIFVITPAMESVALSFFRWDGFSAWVFNGIENYIRMFTKDPYFYPSLINTFTYQIGVTIGTVVVGFILAVIIDLKIKLWRIYRVAFFLPYVLAQFAVATLWRTVFAPDGLANSLLGNLGLSQVAWFGILWVVKAVLIFVTIWQYSSFPMIFFLAGMQNIDEEIYEAAKIDGANTLQRIIKITIPMLKNVLSIIIVLQFIFSFKVFTYVYIMTEGRPAGLTHVVGTLLYRYAFRLNQFGYSSVLSIIMILVALIFAFIYIKTSGYEEILKKK